MNKSIFIFITSFFVLSPLILFNGVLGYNIQLYFCIPLILVLGIPHGAIDNVLFNENKKLSLFKFVSIYLTVIGINILLWISFPVFSYSAFLLISAYHFGQSQFSNHLENKYIPTKSLYFTWGITVLSGLIYFNFQEISDISSSFPEFAVLYQVHGYSLFKTLFACSAASTLMLLGIMAGLKWISLETLVLEVLVLSLISLCFYLMPLLIGFTFYFVNLHSLKVLREEFSFLKLEKTLSSFQQFIKLIAPFSLLSFAGIGLLLALIYFGVLNVSYGYLFLIIISSITVPHAFVMNKFYNLLSERGINKRLST